MCTPHQEELGSWSGAMPFHLRLAARVARPGLLALAAALAACAQPRPEPPTPRVHLYERALKEIDTFYIAPISNERLVLDGAARLALLDKKLSVSEAPAPGNSFDIALRYGNRQLAALPLPADRGARTWGRLADRIVTDAKTASPVLATLPAERIDDAVLDGMARGLDRFSHYSTPTAAADEHAARDGFGGIGVTLSFPDGKFEIAGVEPQGPAGRAGLRPGDRIIAIDGAPTAEASPSTVIHLLRGPVRSTVVLTVLRPKLGRRTLQVRRTLITPSTVSETELGDIAVLRVSSFNRETSEQIAADLRRFEPHSLRGIVLDLRGNPGGLLDQAIAVADLFIAHGPIAATIGRNPASRQTFAASGKAVAPRRPMVVLVDGGSASASEVVASALQDHRRAVIVGSASYGKGTVQTVLRLPNHGTLTVTWALLVTPEGYLLNRHGVVPTLCTAGLGHGAATLLQARIAARSPSRANLDDPAWARLRRACPPRHGPHPIDLKLAQRLLSDPAVYRQALQAIGPSRSLAAAPATGARRITDPATLTPAGASLFSNRESH